MKTLLKHACLTHIYYEVIHLWQAGWWHWGRLKMSLWSFSMGDIQAFVVPSTDRKFSGNTLWPSQLWVGFSKHWRGWAVFPVLSRLSRPWTFATSLINLDRAICLGCSCRFPWKLSCFGCLQWPCSKTCSSCRMGWVLFFVFPFINRRLIIKLWALIRTFILASFFSHTPTFSFPGPLSGKPSSPMAAGSYNTWSHTILQTSMKTQTR